MNDLLRSVPLAVLFAVTILANITGGILKTWFSKKKTDSAFDFYLYNTVISLVSALVIFVMNRGIGAVSAETLALSVIFGIVTALGAVLNSMALTCGPWTYTAMFTALSTVIPTLSGVFLWDESISIGQYVGIFLLIACIVLSAERKATDKKATARWFFLCALLFFAIGSVGVLQKVQRRSAHADELGAFLMISFLIGAAFLGFCAFLFRKKAPSRVHWTKNLFPWVSALFTGIAVALNNVLNLFLSGEVPTVVFFPLVNGSALMLTAVSSLVLFRERLSPRRWIGLFVGVLSLLFVCQILHF